MDRVIKRLFLCICLFLPELLADDGVCKHLVRVTKMETERTRVTYIERYKDKCYKLFTCQKTRYNYHWVNKNVERVTYAYKYYCCPGYTSTYQQYYDPYSSSSKIECTPVCSNGCSHGMHCVSPEECSCHEGYEEINNTCIPICTDECVNATCTAPDTCVCLDGFKNTPGSTNECEPHCSQECSNGFCTSPEVCACHEGFEKNNDICKPICTPECINATCNAPNTCECFDGFILIPGSTKECAPHCSQECSNGFCTSPELCACHEGFEKVNDICNPICTDECINATCISPETCVCVDGFRNNPDSPNACSPYCSKGCSNGVCTEPDVCICDEGYEKFNDICNPICIGGCGNGTCIEPNKCQCDDGHKISDNNTCIPHCDNCNNGICVAPNICECSYGYLRIDNECRPQCDGINCENGICTTPNVCKCNEGYIRGSEICEPVCDKCVNGYCKSPDQCECFQGFVPSQKDPYLCETFKCSRCMNGECEYPGICKCYDGFNLVDEDCEPVCNSCVNAVCKAPAECECLPGYIYVTENVCGENIEFTTETSQSTYTLESALDYGVSITLAENEEITEFSTESELFEANSVTKTATGNWIFYMIGIAVVIVLSAIFIVVWKKGLYFKRGEYSTEDGEGSIIFNGTNTIERLISE